MLRKLLFNPAKDYRNYRWFYTSQGSLVIGGKNEDQNELVLRNFLKPSYTVIHTSKPGSGFMIIQNESPSKKDLEETSVFCACFSKQWKSTKKNSKIEVDIFKGNQLYKNKEMKKGTFGVNGAKKSVKVKPELILIMQKGKLKAVPKTKDFKEEILATIKPGKLDKEKAVEKIAKKIKDKFHFPASKEEIRQAIPSDCMDVK